MGLATPAAAGTTLGMFGAATASAATNSSVGSTASAASAGEEAAELESAAYIQDQHSGLSKELIAFVPQATRSCFIPCG